MPVPAVAGEVEDVVVRGDDELQARGLVGVEDRPVVGEERRPRLVAVAAVDVVVAVGAVVVVGDALGARPGRRGVVLLPDEVDAAHEDVRPHPDLLHDGDRALGLGRGRRARDPLHVLAVRDGVREDRLHLPPHQLLVAAVEREDLSAADVVVEADAEVHPGIGVGHRSRKLEVEDPDGDGNGERPEPDLAAVGSGGRAGRDMRREEELLADALLQRDGPDRLRVGETGAHRRKGGRRDEMVVVASVQEPRGIEPPLGRRPVRPRDAGVVRLLRRVDADEVLVVQEELGAELEARVGEVAEPPVLVLVPDLDDREVERVRGEDVAVLVHERSDDGLHLAEVGVGVDDERAGLVFAARGDDADRAAALAVGGDRVRQALDIAHRRHSPPRRASPARKRRAHGKRRGDRGGKEDCPFHAFHSTIRHTAGQRSERTDALHDFAFGA